MTRKAIPRSWLFVPGDRPERFAKALACGADRVVVDLEDAVDIDRKDAARHLVHDFLATSDQRVCLRINGADTPYFADDCELLALPSVAAVMVPKAEASNTLDLIASRSGAGMALIPLIETARGLDGLSALCEVPQVACIAFGSVDFQLDLGIEGDGVELLFARSRLVLASRLAGLGAPVDGVTLATTDATRLGHDAQAARRLGFGGKLCIHPSQVATVNAAFSVKEEDKAWARGVLKAAVGSTTGALTYEGKLVDRPVLERARSLLQRL